jgi:integrase/recombinase XerD
MPAPRKYQKSASAGATDGQPDEPAFPTRTGWRLSRDAIEHRLATHAAVAASRCPSLHGEKLSPHNLRHTAVTNARNAGVPLRDVQIAARHADPRTTVGYDRARENLDRHAIHALTAYLAGAC